MSFKESSVLLALGAVWGASFMLIKVGGAEIGAFALVEMRLGLAAAIMLALGVLRRGTLSAALRNWKPLLVMGVINCMVPYTLITWGENYVSSGLAAIYNACAPLWGVILFVFIPQTERLTRVRLAGLIVAFLGVILVVGGSLSAGGEGWSYVLGQGACLLAALSYAVAGIYGRSTLKGVSPQVAATGQLTAGSLLLLPLALMQMPERVPSFQALGAVALLSIAGTVLASLMYYWLLERVGPTRVLLVTYLMPIFALIWGALLLGEAVSLQATLGLALVLGGVAITSGSGANLLDWARSSKKVRETARPSSAPALLSERDCSA